MNVVVKGNGHTVYNLHIENGGHTRLCKAAVRADISDLTFVSAYFRSLATESTADIGLVPRTNNTADDLVSMSNVVVSDGIFIHEHTIASGSRHVGAFAGYAWNLRFSDCHSQRNTIIGMDHVGGFMGEYETAFFTDCSSEKNTVLAFGGHSGAFASLPPA